MNDKTKAKLENRLDRLSQTLQKVTGVDELNICAELVLHAATRLMAEHGKPGFKATIDFPEGLSVKLSVTTPFALKDEDTEVP